MRIHRRNTQTALSAGKQRGKVAVGFIFVSNWSRGWREFSRPIKDRPEAKSIHFRNTLETMLNTVLYIL